MNERLKGPKGKIQWKYIIILLLWIIFLPIYRNFSPLKIDFSYDISGYAYMDGAKEPASFSGSAHGTQAQYVFRTGNDQLAFNLSFMENKLAFGGAFGSESQFACSRIQEASETADAEGCGWAVFSFDQSVIAMEFELDGQRQLLLLSKSGLSESEIRSQLRDSFSEHPEWKTYFTLF